MCGIVGRASCDADGASAVSSSASIQLVHFSARRCPAEDGIDNRHVEADQEPGSARQRGELTSHDLGRVPHHFAPAIVAGRSTDPREQQPHVVVDLRRRADRRPRIADAVLLPDGDGRRDAVDAIDVGLLHPLEKLPRIGGQRFHVPSLAFGVDRIEGERRLARPAHAGDDDQLAERQRDVDILQVVRAGPSNDEISGFNSPSG